MAQIKIIWTVLPHGRVTEGPLKGRLQASIVVSPRLTPEAAEEQTLGAAGYAVFHNWPATLKALKLTAVVNGHDEPLKPLTDPDEALWATLFGAHTPVAGFEFKDMSRVNLRSFSVRNVVKFVRTHYGNLVTQSAREHPTLLPWGSATNPALQGMLTAIGTSIEGSGRGGLGRFYDDKLGEQAQRVLRDQVYSDQGETRRPVVGIDGKLQTQTMYHPRTLPADWQALPPAVQGLFRTKDEYTFYQADSFYRRKPLTDEQQKLRRPDFKDLADAVKAPEFDFHQMLASYTDWPHLLRRLGLIIDVAFPANGALEQALAQAVNAQNGFADGIVRVEIGWPGELGHDPEQDGYPNTAWRLDKQRFIARERSNDHRNGLLRLEGAADLTLGEAAKPNHHAADFDVFQLDPDGSALKTVDYTLSAQRLIQASKKPGTHGGVTYTTGDRQPVSTLRSGGLAVARHDRAVTMADFAAATKLKNDAIAASAAQSRDVVLFSEDVLRGYRVDVMTRDQWFSLCQRVGEYTIQSTGEPLPLPADEGYVKAASTSGDGKEEHYLHETLFKWTGWSLVAERPGRTIRAKSAPDSGLQSESVEFIDEQVQTGHGVVAQIKAAPRTLPKLRFGHSYRFRARTVDLAGNSLELDHPVLKGLDQASDEVPYLRFEPVDPPALVHRHRVSEGESLERMVIRSNFDASPDDYLKTDAFINATNGAPEDVDALNPQPDPLPDFEYRAANERHVVPPKASQQQCELHGVFDQLFNDLRDPESIRKAYAVAAREAGTLYDAQRAGDQIRLVTPNSVSGVAQTSAVPLEMPSDSKPTGDRLVGGQYVIHRQEQVITPYLPDPAADCFVLRGDARVADMERIGVTQEMDLGDGAFVVRAPDEELVLVVRYSDHWPDRQGLRIVLRERRHHFDLDRCDEVFADDGRPVWNPDTRELTLFMRKGHVARLRYASGLAKALVDQFALPYWAETDAKAARVRRLALLGSHWMLTPFRPLVLVHATQQPVCEPRLTKLGAAARDLGQTFADLDGAVHLHGPSTGDMEVVAEWDEWVDDLQQPAPKRVHMQARLAKIRLPENGPNDFGLAFAAQQHTLPPVQGASAPAVQALGNRHDFGDTKFRLIQYRLLATTRFREYLPPALYAVTPLVTREGKPALVNSVLVGASDDPGAAVLANAPGAVPAGLIVKSSLPPDPPKLVYTVPSFQWSKNLGAALTTQSSTRFGNGLRVYLDRPWFSSGDGELLGVVMYLDKAAAPAKFSVIPEAMQPYVTQWGLDPLFDSEAPRDLIKEEFFPARVHVGDVTLQENQSLARVVGHRVQWDAQRQQWYADIDIDAGKTYMPFVRLALVRYQPHAIAQARVSRVVLAEFAQLLPRRKAVLQRVGQTLAISLHGPVPDHGPMLSRNDSPIIGMSLIPAVIGSVLETGRNSVELVLQTRDPAMDSDLAWRDVGTLAEGLATPQDGVFDLVVKLADQPAQAGGQARVSPEVLAQALQLGQQDNAAQGRAGWVNKTQAAVAQFKPAALGEAAVVQGKVTITTGDLAAGPVFGPAGGGISNLIDPAIWAGTATLPDLQGKPARLVIREFERYYADRWVTKKIGNNDAQQRVVESRLVYTAEFPLN